MESIFYKRGSLETPRQILKLCFIFKPIFIKMFYALALIIQLQILSFLQPSHCGFRLGVDAAEIRAFSSHDTTSLGNQSTGSMPDGLPPPPLQSSLFSDAAADASFGSKRKSPAAEGTFIGNAAGNHLKNLKKPSTVEYQVSARSAASRKYDYIIVGGGAVGCPLARTLAESGKSVLLIERGGSRNQHPQTLDIYGAGIVIDNAEVSQQIQTSDGVISHVASVLSGGSAINMAIIIEETDEYFNYLETFPGVKFDRAKLKEASDWVLDWLPHPMPETLPYGQRWRLGLDKVYGPNRGYSTTVATNSSWIGASAFDADNNWFRAAADVALGRPGIDFPPSLHVLLHHNVHKIDFEFNPKTKKHRAVCVQFSKTTAADLAPIAPKKPSGLFGFPSLLKLFGRSKPEFSGFIPPGLKLRACVNFNGQIISSAGALLTPLLMYKSGVGPKSIVNNLRVSLVKEFPEIGKGLRDRVLIPIGLFFNEQTPNSGHPPRICQSLGFSKTGFDCELLQLGTRSMNCTYTNAEELSGARIAEGTIYATRYILPPQIRNDPVVDMIFQSARDCADGRIPLNNPLLSGLCILSQPLADCFRKVAANFYFTAEPKSLAEIHVTSRGEFIVSGNYLTHPQDLQDAMRGVANLIRVINSNVYDGVFQPAGPDSCPLKILNGLLQIALHETLNWQDIIAGLSSSSSSAAAAVGSRSSKNSDVGANNFEGSINELQRFVQSELEGFSSEAKAIEEWKRMESEAAATTTAVLNSTVAGAAAVSSSAAAAAAAVDKELEGSWMEIFGRSEALDHKKYWTSQRYATYPPSIPEPSDAEGLKRFAKTFMTSVWHWVGSAQMGEVVDSSFRVNGFENLRIVDASVMNQVTRVNPFFTLLSIGRYAGLLIREEENNSSSSSSC